MTISEIIADMIDYSDGNIHDIDHFLHVWSYASTIGHLEGLDERTQRVLEVAAIVHDIACPLCREKYGNTNGKYQEAEGPALAREFLAGKGLTDAEVERVCYLVGHHHTFTDIDGVDYQILIEADYIVGACEGSYSRAAVTAFLERVCRTASGARLLRSVFQLDA